MKKKNQTKIFRERTVSEKLEHANLAHSLIVVSIQLSLGDRLLLHKFEKKILYQLGTF